MFLVWDVLSAAWEPIDAGLAAHHDTGAGLGSTVGYGVLFAVGLTVGLLGLQQYEAWMGRSVRRARSRQSIGPGAMASQELAPRGISSWSSGKQLALLIAVGIGLHNLGEGVAIGSAYSAGSLALGAFLVIGFALHNTTEGIAIVVPIASLRPSLARLGLLGLIAGVPAVLGAWIGAAAFNSSLAAFLFGFGAGAIVQVIVQLAPSLRDDDGRLLHEGAVAGLLVGLAIMFATGLLVSV
jgi:zinc transporter, ZIP family